MRPGNLPQMLEIITYVNDVLLGIVVRTEHF